MLCDIVQLSFKAKSQLYSESMDVNRGSEIYAVELDDMQKGPTEEGTVDYKCSCKTF